MIIMTKFHIGKKVWHRTKDGNRSRYTIVGIDIKARGNDRTEIFYHLLDEEKPGKSEAILASERQLLGSKQLLNVG